MNNEASKITAIKDQAIGAIKETIGTFTGNSTMELVGKAQKIHGKNEYEYAQAQKQGESEPEKFKKAYHHQSTPASASGKVEGIEASSFSGAVNQFVGGVKESMGSATNNHQMELLGKAQNFHGRNEAEFAKAERNGLSEPEQFAKGTKTTESAEGSVEQDSTSSFSAIKDQAVGVAKETIGHVTGSQNLELLGKAQKVHGKNQAEFAKAEKEGLSEPQHFIQGTKVSDHAEGIVEGENVSSINALKDRALGSVKETIGSVTGNQKMELLGKAQNVHGRNVAEFAKAQEMGLAEPDQFVHGTKVSEHAQGSIEPSSSLSAMKDRAIGSVKETVGSFTGNHEMELIGKAQNVHGRNVAEFAEAERSGLAEPEQFAKGTKTCQHAEGTVESDSTSSFSSLKDRTVGSVKEMIGSVTHSHKTELLGKAQSVHGRNLAEFAKAESCGENEPQHFASGTKSFEKAEGSIEGENSSTLSSLKDRTLGAVKETFGSALHDEKMELLGRAQRVHGRNEAEFAKAENKGLSEPEQFIHGTKITEHAKGIVEEEKTSTLSTIKDRAVGSMKESFGIVTGNQTTELLGKAQHVHARNAAEFEKAERKGLTEPEHFVDGSETCQHATGSVEDNSYSAFTAVKDQTVGAVKEAFGSVTGNQNLELVGKAQSTHARNAAEFAKAKSNDVEEPQPIGCQNEDQTNSLGNDEDVSKLSSLKDRFVGAVKEKIGSATDDHKMELIGKAQNVHGRNAVEFA